MACFWMTQRLISTFSSQLSTLCRKQTICQANLSWKRVISYQTCSNCERAMVDCPILVIINVDNLFQLRLHQTPSVGTDKVCNCYHYYTPVVLCCRLMDTFKGLLFWSDIRYVGYQHQCFWLQTNCYFRSRSGNDFLLSYSDCRGCNCFNIYLNSFTASHYYYVKYLHAGCLRLRKRINFVETGDINQLHGKHRPGDLRLFRLFWAGGDK